MAYKSFIKSIGSTVNAGVGFLPVPFKAEPQQTTTFATITNSGGGFVRCSGVPTTAHAKLLVNDILQCVSDDLTYNFQAPILNLLSGNIVDLGEPYTVDAGTGVLTFISRP